MRIRQAGDLPGPRGRRFVGNLQDYESDRLGFLERAHRDHGAVVRFDSRTTIVNDAQLARYLLKRSRGEFQISEDFLQRPLSEAQVDTVLRVRPLLDPGLRPRALAPTLQAIETDTRRHMRSVSGSTVDPLPLMEAITSRAITTFYFGEDGETIRGPIGALLDALTLVIGNPFALPARIWSPRRDRIKKLHHEAKQEVLTLLAPRLANPAQFSDAATGILHASSRRNPHPLPRLADLMIGAMLAGYRVPPVRQAEVRHLY